jgi:hypothetical protein
VPFAVLAEPGTAWPTQPARDQGYLFKGYRFDESRRPIFEYQFGRISIDDHVRPVKNGQEVRFERSLSLTVQPGDPIDLRNLYFLAATGAQIEANNDGSFRVDNVLNLRVSGSSQKPHVRQAGARQELLLPLDLSRGTTKIEEQFVW